MADADKLAAAIDEAGDYRVLLMALVHLTGDTSWLEPPFTPVRDVSLIADSNAGLGDEARSAIRNALIAELTSDEVVPAIGDPGDELMVQMMRTCLGEEVGDEYAPMMREELGFTNRDVEMPSLPPASEAEAPMVVIVGAGVSGLALGAVLTRAEIPYVIIEKRDGVGGTWFDNRYPGCGVDTPNHAYSFSHGDRYDWSRYFSPRGEIADYLERCADDFNVTKCITFGTEVVGACWDEAAARWHIETRSGEVSKTITARVLVSAIGVLDVPKAPAIDGLDDFEGSMFHTARWPTDIDLAGRDVAVIGTGASSMQLVPSIADEVGKLTVYQRSPQWVRPIDGYGSEIPEPGRWLLRHVPFYAEWFRFIMSWRYGDGLLPYLRRDPEWPHPERSMNRTNDRHRVEMTKHLETELEGHPEMLEQCQPDYPPFGKRILLDNGWYRTICRDDVDLVTESIEKVVDGGVLTSDGQLRSHDIIVQASGFQTTQMTARLGVVGRDGVDLSDVWANDDPRAHLGITVPGFPNMFIMLGPNTGLGHGGSTVFMSECQARYISTAIAKLLSDDLAAIEVKQEVHDAYNERVDSEHAELIWTHPGMTNWYRNSNGRNTALVPWRLVDYWGMTHDIDLEEFHLQRIQ